MDKPEISTSFLTMMAMWDFTTKHPYEFYDTSFNETVGSNKHANISCITNKAFRHPYNISPGNNVSYDDGVIIIGTLNGNVSYDSDMKALRMGYNGIIDLEKTVIGDSLTFVFDINRCFRHLGHKLIFSMKIFHPDHFWRLPALWFLWATPVRLKRSKIAKNQWFSSIFDNF